MIFPRLQKAAVLTVALTMAMPFCCFAEETPSPSAPADSSSASSLLTYPTVNSDYLYLEDSETGQVLWSVNPDTKMYPASMTKMMTEILAIEHLPDVNTAIPITDEMLSGLAEANATTAGFSIGDEPTMLDCLYGVALPSGADAVNALAITVSGSIDSFVELMNQKALELGMINTHFVNPTGLYEDDHYSTVHDIAILMKYCLQSELFHSLISTPTYTTSSIASHPDGLAFTSTFWKYLSQGGGDIFIDGFEGGKTGYTTNAGNCLASVGSENGIPVILVTAHSMTQHGIMDAAAIYPWIAASYEKKTILNAGDLLTSIEVADTLPKKKIDITADATVTLDLPVNISLTIVNSTAAAVYAPVHGGDILGTYKILNGDEVLYEQTMTAPSDIGMNLFAKIWRILSEFAAHHPLLAVFYGLVIIFLLVLLYRYIVISIRRRKQGRRRQMRHKKNR